MVDLQKSIITLGGVPLAATQAIVWRFISGVVPYTTIFSVHHTNWISRLHNQRGKPLDLVITNSYGKRTTIKQVYILHESPSDSPHRINFVVSDKRWKWQYHLIVRDFNMPRKTGDRTANLTSVPVETRVVVDRYDYLSYSLNRGENKWLPQDALRSVMAELEDSKTGGSWRIESFPLKEQKQAEGAFTLQGVTLRDAGSIAVSRLLSYIPGADIYINAAGFAVIYDATDLDIVDNYFKNLPVATYTGERAIMVDRVKIRPKEVVIHYQREVEVVLSFRDDYGPTTAPPNPNAPYLDNVIPTVDPETELTEYDPEARKSIKKKVPPGTWVRVDKWLVAMNNDKPEGSLPWTFDTIKRHWLKGDLDGVLGARGLDLDKTANVAMRVQALKQHFRQTFRINRRYMERVRDILAIRVALLDPVTGARAPAAVWGQACIIPSTKGKYMASRSGDPTKTKVFRNVDYLQPSKESGVNLIQTPPGPTRVNLVDRELGIFRLDWITSPYGTIESFVPCHLVGETSKTPESVTRDLAQQDTKPVGVGMIVESGTNGIFLRNFLEYKVILTIIPAAPNNELQFHRETVEAGDVKELFRKEFRIENGEGPTLEVFVPPGEATARFAWSKDVMAEATIQKLLGLGSDNPATAGIEGPELPGFVLINEKRHLTSHAISLAAELLAAFADSVQGTVVTRVPDGELKIVGNMAGTTIRVAQAPSAKVDTVHQFPGQQRKISRLALMPESTRAIVLGTIPFKE